MHGTSRYAAAGGTGSWRNGGTEMRFGFSYVGLGMLLALFIPNLLWTKRQPQGYRQCAAQESRVLLGLERAGQVLVTALSLIFSDFNLKPWQPWNLWLLGAAFLLLLYELYWIRYFRSGRTLADFYSDFWGIPLAGATLPVAAFLFLAIYGRNPLLAGADILLGIGHIGIHRDGRRRAMAPAASAIDRDPPGPGTGHRGK